MTQYDYKVVPAPARGLKAKGVKGAEARFAHAMETQLNELAAEGWEFQRAETLPSEERQGLTSSVTNYRSLLVFRRLKTEEAAGVDAAVQADGFQPMPVDPADEKPGAEAEPDEAPAAEEASSDREVEGEMRDALRDRDMSEALRDRVAQLMDKGETQKAD
ncbi:DUF4177 domain-containing protein [Thalassobius sp. MITS945101]|uniref:DUF4177 domain-containing protein n=1 Tax=Thalassobius sp. MITS945101 TaxID=3096994 RepID=UPI0039995D17